MQRIYQHAGIRGFDIDKQCDSLCQRVDMGIGNEFQHHPYLSEVGCRTEARKVSREPSAIGVITHYNKIPSGYLLWRVVGEVVILAGHWVKSRHLPV